MATELKMTLLLRRAEFADSCKLQLGEPGYHTGTKEFKIGDGQTTWANLPIANKTQIQAMIDASIDAHKAGYYTKEEIDDLLEALQGAIDGVSGQLTAEVTARENADTQIRKDFAAADASTLADAKGYADTKKAEVIGTSADAKTADTVYGAKAFATDAAATAKSEAISAAAADATSKANAAEAAAKAHAETKASAAQSAAIAEAEAKDVARAQAAATALSEAKTELEGKISTGDSTTLQSAKDYTDEKVAAEAKLRSDADDALDERLEKLEAFFEGADHDGENGGLKDALDTLVEIQTYIETEGAAADEMVKDIAQNASDIDALEGRMGTAESTITSLGANKLDKTTYEDYIAGKEMSDAALKSYADGKANTAQANAEAKAAELDGALKAELQAEIDSDVATAIAAEVTRSDAKAKELADAAETAAKNYADSQDAALKTAIEGGEISGDTTAKTIKGAKEFAAAKAAAAQSAAEATAAADATAKANAAQAAAEATAAADATSKANTAEKNAKDYADTEIGKEKTRAEGQEAAIRGEFAAADTATLTAAKAYADEKVTDAHKNYQTATVKDAAHDSATNPSFITSISIDKGHVTGATVRNLAEVLEAMTFIFDGGTSAN